MRFDLFPKRILRSTPVLARARADYNDGTGRDMYLCQNLLKIPATGKTKFSERPPSQQSRKQHVRTDPLPLGPDGLHIFPAHAGAGGAGA